MDQSTEHTSIDANIELVVQAGALIGSGFADRDDHPFADDFVFHFFNPQLPDLAGDYQGFEGIADLFERLAEVSETGFHNVPHSLTPYGDELLVAFATNTLGFGGTMIDVDAVVVWRVFGGRIHEAWDIPAVNTVRPHRPSPERTEPSPSNPTDRHPRAASWSTTTTATTATGPSVRSPTSHDLVSGTRSGLGHLGC